MGERVLKRLQVELRLGRVKVTPSLNCRLVLSSTIYPKMSLRSPSMIREKKSMNEDEKPTLEEANHQFTTPSKRKV